jgi:hypothetical protein
LAAIVFAKRYRLPLPLANLIAELAGYPQMGAR